jgi:hypothetical protein
VSGDSGESANATSSEDTDPTDESSDDSGATEPTPSGGGVSAVVYLSTQQMELLGADGEVLHRFPISSGRNDLTPVGTFAVESKSEIATSSSDYPSITMP